MWRSYLMSVAPHESGNDLLGVEPIGTPLEYEFGLAAAIGGPTLLLGVSWEAMTYRTTSSSNSVLMQT